MNDEKITVRVTSTGQTLDVVVLNKRVDGIEVDPATFVTRSGRHMLPSIQYRAGYPIRVQNQSLGDPRRT